MSIDIDLPRMDRTELEEYVRGRVLAFNPQADTGPDRIDHLALNTLRHVHTTFDREQSTERLLAAHVAIVEAYPHLAVAAEQQNAARLRRDAVFGVYAFAHSSRTPQEVADFRAARERDSLAAIAAGDYTAGQRASFTRNRRTHTGTIAWVGKVKVGIELTAPDGGTFVEGVHASDVTPSAT